MRRPLLAPERIMVCTAATWLFLRPGVLAVPVDLESATSCWLSGAGLQCVIYILFDIIRASAQP